MSELRQDLVGGDWVILAPERAQRPHELLPEKKPPRKPSAKRGCPFENLKKSGNWPPVFAYPNELNWEVVIIRNKYPALAYRGKCASRYKHGPYEVVEGIGKHELLISRDHEKNIAALSPSKAFRVFLVLKEHYDSLKKDPCIVYVATLFNWGASAGASIYHPHFQILSLPILPPHVKYSLFGSARYFEIHRRCVHCDILGYELKEKKRIVFKKGAAIAVASFASREPFHVTVFPRRHLPYFEDTPQSDLKACVAVLQTVLRKIKRYLHDPDLNFFIHTAPFKEREKYRHYHWHIEISPKILTAGGFELSTGIDINIVDPDQAAATLRRGR